MFTSPNRSIAIMHSALACASAFSGLLSAAIIHMDGIANKPGWAWIFLLVSCGSTVPVQFGSTHA